jgi:predicted transposase YdaD
LNWRWEKGLAKGREEIARSALMEGLSLETIRKITGLDIETIRNIAP